MRPRKTTHKCKRGTTSRVASYPDLSLWGPLYGTQRSGYEATSRGPDIGVFNFDEGKKLLLDVSIAHPQASTVLPQGAKTAGHAASERDEFKIRKFREEASKLGYLFEPLVMFLAAGARLRCAFFDMWRNARPSTSSTIRMLSSNIGVVACLFVSSAKMRALFYVKLNVDICHSPFPCLCIC